MISDNNNAYNRNMNIGNKKRERKKKYINRSNITIITIMNNGSCGNNIMNNKAI